MRWPQLGPSKQVLISTHAFLLLCQKLILFVQKGSVSTCSTLLGPSKRALASTGPKQASTHLNSCFSTPLPKNDPCSAKRISFYVPSKHVLASTRPKQASTHLNPFFAKHDSFWYKKDHILLVGPHWSQANLRWPQLAPSKQVLISTHACLLLCQKLILFV